MRSCSAAGLVALLALCAACDPKAPRKAEAAGVTHDLVEGGAHWRVTTAHGPVHVWTPSPGVTHGATVIYVHGFLVDVDQAWTEHRLPSQFAVSEVPAMFIACEAPSRGDQPVSWSSLGELLAAVERGTGIPVPRERVIAVGHSGAHLTLRQWLDEPRLDTLVLIDAIYGDVDDFRKWVTADRRRRLIFVGDSDTREHTDKLHASLPDVAVLDRVPAIDAELVRSRIVYIKSDVGHMALVEGGKALPAILRLQK